MQKSQFGLEVLVNGGTTREYQHNGSTYIEGKEGTRFSLRFRNNSGKRVLFVPTVDGISIIDGKEGSHGSRGYIVDAYGSTKIDGWRKSNDKIAEFYFSMPDKSYSVKTGQGKGNLGVIGVAVFEEKEPEKVVYITNTIKEYVPVPYPTYVYTNYPWGQTYTSAGISTGPTNGGGGGGQGIASTGPGGAGGNYTASSLSCNTMLCSSSNDGTKQSQAIGTGWGDTKTSKVVNEEFERGSLKETIRIYYNTKDSLKELGVEMEPVSKISKPKAFKEDNGFCPEP